ncbi:hypothetical protein V8G69_09835 [Gaetbulibacter sp. M235]|uniref:hypothetical protein n=1 Tax=Gaetbulibacter sp. M235 TaxID=3126510 RepID=UPI00374FA5A1
MNTIDTKFNSMLKKNKFKTAILITYSLASLLLISVLIIGTKLSIPFEKFTGDPALNSNSNPFVGVISNLGVLLWCCTASICIFSGVFILNIYKKHAAFLIFSGIFTAILMFDDLFMFHDYGIYLIIPFDFAQNIVLISYMIFSLFYIIRFYKTILLENYFILGTAFFFLGLSIFIDMLFESGGLEYFIEDGLKFLGIVSWMLFFNTTSYKYLKKSLN